MGLDLFSTMLWWRVIEKASIAYETIYSPLLLQEGNDEKKIELFIHSYTWLDGWHWLLSRMQHETRVKYVFLSDLSEFIF